ncbi:hypothetical protein J6590_049093 [Homalodisca vitripennis]|nr:hypothetical protein J6590_049093 [Homalodisca vitripennis]
MSQQFRSRCEVETQTCVGRVQAISVALRRFVKTQFPVNEYIIVTLRIETKYDYTSVKVSVLVVGCLQGSL